MREQSDTRQVENVLFVGQAVYFHRALSYLFSPLYRWSKQGSLLYVHRVCDTPNRHNGSRVRSRPGTILSWRLIMKQFLRSFSPLPLIYSRRVVVSYKRKYVHKLLVNRLLKPAQEKVWLSELTVPQ